MFLFLFYYQPLNRARKVVSVLLCGISPTLSQRQRHLFIYLFIVCLRFVYESESARHVVSSLGREKTGFQYIVWFMFLWAAISFSSVGSLLI